ncbi:MAG: hypothetical protein HUJ70_15365 [Pseudobutyrivibrio sp.]|nr:hypothetical protein [Pseudobutyrivibrio sp.]
MGTRLYAQDKPKDCRYCHWWESKKKGCVLTEERCYYLLKPPEEKITPCTGCCYGRTRQCVGYCLKKAMGQGGVE